MLALLCQPAELQAAVPVPDDIELWGLDSGERHAVGGSDYGAVRTGAFMGLRILSEHMAVPGEYLANIAVDQFEQELARHLPEEMSGDEFLARYGGTADPVTSVEPGTTVLRARTGGTSGVRALARRDVSPAAARIIGGCPPTSWRVDVRISRQLTAAAVSARRERTASSRSCAAKVRRPAYMARRITGGGSGGRSR